MGDVLIFNKNSFRFRFVADFPKHFSTMTQIHMTPGDVCLMIAPTAWMSLLGQTHYAAHPGRGKPGWRPDVLPSPTLTGF